MVLSQFRQNVNFAQCSIYNFSRFFWWGGWGGGGDKTFPKFAESFVESFAKILAKFHELKISKKPQHYAQRLREMTSEYTVV